MNEPAPNDQRPGAHDRSAGDGLAVIDRRMPPPSQANDAVVLLAAAFAGLLGLAFGVTLLLDAPVWLHGGCLALGLFSLAIAVRRYFVDRFPDVVATESRTVDRGDSEAPLSDVEPVARRSFLGRALVAAGGLFGLGLLAPVASLGPAPEGALARTAWRQGTYLVNTQGQRLRAEEIASGGIATIWPEGAIGQERSSVVLIRLRVAPSAPTNPDWVVGEGLVAYSKVCTHAGCPVALYRERDDALFCPCHQSTFDASRGAVPTFGPAARALPQLPLGVDADGLLVALGDFTDLVGPPKG